MGHFLPLFDLVIVRTSAQTLDVNVNVNVNSGPGLPSSTSSTIYWSTQTTCRWKHRYIYSNIVEMLFYPSTDLLEDALAPLSGSEAC